MRPAPSLAQAYQVNSDALIMTGQAVAMRFVSGRIAMVGAILTNQIDWAAWRLSAPAS